MVRVSTILLFLRVRIVIAWSDSVFGYVVGSVVDDDVCEDVVVCLCGDELMNDDNVLGQVEMYLGGCRVIIDRGWMEGYSF